VPDCAMAPRCYECGPERFRATQDRVRIGKRFASGKRINTDKQGRFQIIEI